MALFGILISGLILIIGLAEGLGTCLPWRVWRIGWTYKRIHYLPGAVLLEGDNRWWHVLLGLHVRTDRTSAATNDAAMRQRVSGARSSGGRHAD